MSGPVLSTSPSYIQSTAQVFIGHTPSTRCREYTVNSKSPSPCEVYMYAEGEGRKPIGRLGKIVKWMPINAITNTKERKSIGMFEV